MPSSIDVMPWPARVAVLDAAGPQQSAFRVRFTGVRTPRLERAVARLLGNAADDSSELVIECGAESGAVPRLHDDEAYSLRTSEGGAEIAAANEWGVLHGLATLVQLLSGRRAVAVDDRPRFAWRGLLLDVARHFLPVAALERTLDGMAAAKLNVLHLHLTDDQGFRFPSEAFPELTRRGGQGVYYSRVELRRLVAYAADRGIRVVPEIDVPGHVTSWLAAQPEWGARRRRLAPSPRFGVHEAVLDPSNEAVYRALETLFAEVAAVFPDEYLHVGGDEVNPKWWRASRPVQRWMAKHGYTNTSAAQAAFSARLVHALASLGRKAVGWDEILHADLPKGTLIQSWRGAVTRDRTLAAGFNCLFSAGYYLDLFYPADVHYRFDPEASPEALAAAEAVAVNDPRLAHIREGLLWAQRFAQRGAAPTANDGAKGRVLGGEACLWSELVNASVLDVRLWSRLPAVAERLWSEAHVTDVTDMQRRLAAFQAKLPRLARIDLERNVHDAFAVRGLDTAAQLELRPLFDMLEPVKWYMRLLGKETLAARVAGRESGAPRPYRVSSRLDRLADLLPPESPAARSLAGADPARVADAWRAQHPALVRLAKRRSWLREVLPLSEALVALADVIDGTVHGAQARAALERAAEPHADLVLAVVPAVRAFIGE